MAELSNLHVKITGDSNDARVAVAKLQVATYGMQGSLDQLNKKMKTLGPTMDRSTKQAVKGLKDFNRSAATSRFHSANLFAQFQDIGVMIASGQSPFILAAQQGSQISQVLASIGGTGKSQFAALAAAARTFISPMNLIVVGAVAVVAALGQWGLAALSTGEEMKRLAKQVEDVREKAVNMAEEIRALEMGITGDVLVLQDNYNQKLKEANDLYMAHNAAIDAGGKGFKDRVEDAFAAAQAAWEELAAFKEMEGRLGKLKEEEQARAQATKDAEAALEEANEWLLEAVGNSAELSKNMREAAQSAVDMVASGAVGPDAARSQLQQEGRIGGALVGVLGVNKTGPDSETETSRGGAAKEDPLKRDLEQLQQKLATELELEQSMYAERQKILEEALEKKYIKQKEFDELMERENERHQQQMAAIDVWRHGSSLDQTEAFMGQMASALQSGNDKMLRIAKVFGAAEALINSFRTYNQVMADPTLPWFAKIPAAVSLLGNAMGMVNAIKGVGGGGGGGVSASVPAGAGQAVGGGGAAVQPQQQRSLTLIGDRFNRQQAIEIAEFMNEGTDDGLVIRGRR